MPILAYCVILFTIAYFINIDKKKKRVLCYVLFHLYSQKDEGQWSGARFQKSGVRSVKGQRSGSGSELGLGLGLQDNF